MSVLGSTSCWPGSTPSSRSASAIHLLAGLRNTSSTSQTWKWHVTPWIPGWKVWHRWLHVLWLHCYGGGFVLSWVVDFKLYRPLQTSVYNVQSFCRLVVQGKWLVGSTFQGGDW